MNAEILFDSDLIRNCVMIDLSTDDVLEIKEDFKVNLITQDSSTSLSPDEATITIQDTNG